MCHFLHQILLVAAPHHHHHQAPCEDLGVNTGFKARFVCLCVCVCISVVGGGFQWDGWVGVRWGQEVVLSPSSRSKGDGPPHVYMCVCESVCCVVLCCVGRACRLCIGRGSSACREVTKHTNAHTQITQLKEWKPFLQKELVRMSQI